MENATYIDAEMQSSPRSIASFLSSAKQKLWEHLRFYKSSYHLLYPTHEGHMTNTVAHKSCKAHAYSMTDGVSVFISLPKLLLFFGQVKKLGDLLSISLFNNK